MYTGSTIPSKTTNKVCVANDNSTFNTNQTSSLQCSGDLAHSEFFTQTNYSDVYYLRKRTLFNLYAFPEHLSTYLSPPSLTLTNCNFEYFFGNYESLISVQTNNLRKETFNHTYNDSTNGSTVSQNLTFYTYTGGERGASIQISLSSFKHGRFCRGLITLQKTTIH